MQLEQIENIIRIYEAILVRPAMYFGNSRDYAAFIHFTAGLYQTLFALNQTCPSYFDRQESYRRKGLRLTQFGAVDEMKEKGLSDGEIVKELTSIELDVWKFFRDEFEK